MPRRSILMLTTDQAIDRRILLQAAALDADGWDVTVLAPPGPQAADEPCVVRVGSSAAAPPPRGSAAVLRAYRLVRALVPADAAWLSWLRNATWQHLLPPDVFLQRLFAPAAAGMRADIVVAHDLPVLAAAASIAAHHRAKLVYDSHELYCEQELPEATRRMWAAIERREIGACDAVITVNPAIAGEFARRYGLASVHVIQNAAPATVEPPASQRLFHAAFGLDPSVQIVLLQGGLSAGRNLEALIDAVPLLASPAIHVVFLGNGQLERSLAARAGAAGVAGRVHFHPAVHFRALDAWTASADVGVIPYQPTCLNNLYCTPNKLFEFVAAGLPMIATDLPELRRLIAGYDIGRLAGTGSPPELAAAIDALLGNPSEVERLRRNLIEARRRLNWASEAERLVAIYRGLAT